ncbi:hypothetical protein CRD60_08205, partial [Bifidobacterium aemilianum]
MMAVACVAGAPHGIDLQLKTYRLSDPEGDEGYRLVRARSRNEARAQATYLFEDVSYISVLVRRVPWLDRYRDLASPDAVMARLRHGWWVPNYGFTDAERLVDEYGNEYVD